MCFQFLRNTSGVLYGAWNPGLFLGDREGQGQARQPARGGDAGGDLSGGPAGGRTERLSE